MTVENGVETWLRNFGGKEFRSKQEQGRGMNTGLIVERFGPLAFAMAVVVDDGELHLILRRWSVFGLPLPLLLAPKSQAFETAADGLFRFSVRIALPIIGLLVHYRGWLKPTDDVCRSDTAA